MTGLSQSGFSPVRQTSKVPCFKKYTRHQGDCESVGLRGNASVCCVVSEGLFIFIFEIYFILLLFKLVGAS